MKLPEDTIVDGGYAFVSSYVVGKFASARSFLFLWNPADSGAEAYVDAWVLAQSVGTDPNGIDIRVRTSAGFGTYTDHIRNKNPALWTSAPSKLKLYWGNTAAANLPSASAIVREGWQGPNLNDRAYRSRPALKLPPGYGYVFASAQDNQQLVLDIEHREYQIT